MTVVVYIGSYVLTKYVGNYIMSKVIDGTWVLTKKVGNKTVDYITSSGSQYCEVDINEVDDFCNLSLIEKE